MSRKRNKKRNFPPQQHQPVSQPSSRPPQSVSVPQPTPPSVAAAPSSPQNITFETMEDKIRGEEILFQAENKKVREEREIKKKLDESEVDRRLEQLRKQLGLK